MIIPPPQKKSPLGRHCLKSAERNFIRNIKRYCQNWLKRKESTNKNRILGTSCFCDGFLIEKKTKLCKGESNDISYQI